MTDLKVTDINSRRIRIAWTGVAGATGYRISWSHGGSKREFDYFESLICFHYHCVFNLQHFPTLRMRITAVNQLCLLHNRS